MDNSYASKTGLPEPAFFFFQKNNNENKNNSFHFVLLSLLIMSGFQGESSAAKIQRLDAVFKKAMDVSSASFNEGDIDACFGELKGQYGSVIGKLYKNLIAKTDSSISSAYKDICLRKDLEECMNSLNAPASTTSSKKSSSKSSSSSSSASATSQETNGIDSNMDPLKMTVIGLKRLEMETLKDSIQKMEGNCYHPIDQALRIHSFHMSDPFSPILTHPSSCCLYVILMVS